MKTTEEAAMRYAESLHECEMYDKGTPATKEDMAYAFKAGVNYIMSLPLADRLTSEEKKQIKAIYIPRVYSAEDMMRQNFMEKWMVDAILGPTVFGEKGGEE